MNAVTVISDVVRPEPPRDAVTAAGLARLAKLQKAAEGLDAKGLVALAATEFPRTLTVVSSFGSESAVLLHLMAEVYPNLPVIFLNTGKLFGETLRYRDRLQERLGLGDLRSLAPHPHDRATLDPNGTLWSSNPTACCDFRKVVPLRRALEGFEAQITGRKRFQTRERSAMQTVEYFQGRFRFNPLADWSQADLEAYRQEYELPAHPLVEDGYPSIGCMPCTRRVKSGEDYRAGRWAGLDKDECGIHGIDGEGI